MLNLVYAEKLGLAGLTDVEIDAIAKQLVSQMGGMLPRVTGTSLAVLFKQYDRDTQQRIAAAMIANGADAACVSRALSWAASDTSPVPSKASKMGAAVWSVLATLSMAASLYHGYRRNNSLGWGLAWGALGVIFPVVTPIVAVAQGFGKPKAGRAVSGVYSRRR